MLQCIESILYIGKEICTNESVSLCSSFESKMSDSQSAGFTPALIVLLPWLSWSLWTTFPWNLHHNVVHSVTDSLDFVFVPSWQDILVVFVIDIQANCWEANLAQLSIVLEVEPYCSTPLPSVERNCSLTRCPLVSAVADELSFPFNKRVSCHLWDLISVSFCLFEVVPVVFFQCFSELR